MILTVAALLLAAVSAPSLAANPSAGTTSDVDQVLQITQFDMISERTPLSTSNTAIMAMGEKRLNYYNNVIAKSEQVVTRLNAQGIDTSAMEATIADAQSAVIDPLAAALATGNKTLVASELRSKCLFNGAPYSFHYGAKIGIGGMTAVTAYIEDRAIQAGYGQQIEEIYGHLANAQSTLDAAGTNPYNEEQKKVIKEELKNAANELRSVIKALQHNTGTVPVNAVRKNTAALPMSVASR
jgi:hypothetical protein